jgi:glycosyltransferase involved in cell wall biosynthesis
MEADRLRVLHAYRGGRVGGIQTLFKRTVMALKDAGVQQHLLLGSNSDLPSPEISHRYLSFDHRLLNISTYFSVRSAIKSFKPDIIQTWQHRANWFIRGPFYKIKGHNIPVIRFIGKPIGGRVLEKYYIDSAMLLMPSNAVRHKMIQEGLQPECSSVLRHFCSIELAQPLSRSHHGAIANDGILIVAAGRLSFEKGFDVLLQAVSCVSNVFLWILGSGEEEEKLKSLAKSLGIANRIFFTGWQNNVVSHIATADIVVVPSRSESFGLAIIEAMAQVKPVISTKTQGGCEIVDDNQNGLLCEVDSPDDMVQKINLLFDRDLRHRIGNNARRYVIDNYNPVRAISELLNDYRRVL